MVPQAPGPDVRDLAAPTLARVSERVPVVEVVDVAVVPVATVVVACDCGGGDDASALMNWCSKINY